MNFCRGLGQSGGQGVFVRGQRVVFLGQGLIGGLQGRDLGGLIAKFLLGIRQLEILINGAAAEEKKSDYGQGFHLA